jgi:membrane protease YdiL (CAAX protease family)
MFLSSLQKITFVTKLFNMAFTAFREMKPFSQFIFSMFVILVSFLAFMLISVVVVIPFFGVDSIMSLASSIDMTSPETLTTLKYFQVVQSFGVFIVPPFVLGWLFYGKTTEYLFLNKPFQSSSVLLVVVLMFFAAPFINFIGELNANMVFPEWLSGVESWMKNAEENAEMLTKAFLKVDSVGGLFFNLFMVALLPAVGEELLFRGVVQRIFTRWTRNYHWGIWITAIIFSAIHGQFYGFVPRMLLGALFGYLLVWSGSMWLPILGHFVNNAIAVIAFYFIDKKLLNPNIEDIGSTNGSYYMAAISLGLVVLFLIMIKRQNEKNAITIIQ